MNKDSKKFIVLGVIALFILLFVSKSFTTIGAGERGVVLNFGAVKDTVLGEGLHFIVPFVQEIIKIDVKIQKAQTDSLASTKDLQDTKFSTVINYHILEDAANIIYQKIGIAFEDRVIDPSIQEVVKAASAKYTAEELITQRDKVSSEIKSLLVARLKIYNIIIDDFSIVNFQFSEQFTRAIEDKQTAEQKALTAQRDLERIKFEAMQVVESAKAEAEALGLKKNELNESLIKLSAIEAQLKAIEKWDGILPKVNSGAIPFINIDGISAK
jgi:regulator of protease activity HflC (stomatin/prohibitin superfamily)